MNLNWTDLTLQQRRALAILCQDGPSPLPVDLAEQLINLGLAERLSNLYCVSALGSCLPPTTLH